ncbi:MAG: hypothetical protein K2I05_07570 [Mailhella sp.]|nr:hypothetical protein [Mailhella sp.]
MFFRSSREKQTTVLCPECAEALLIKRTCHEAYMYCGHCGKSFELKDFIPQMDTAMEEFLENLYSNRI